MKSRWSDRLLMNRVLVQPNPESVIYTRILADPPRIREDTKPDATTDRRDK